MKIMKIRASAAALMCAILLSACGSVSNDSGNPAGTMAAGTVKTEKASDTAEVTETELLKGPELPDIDRNGETVTVLYREAMKNEFMADDQNGGVVNDAIYAKNLSVEEQFNIKLDFIANPSQDWNGGYQSMVSKSVLAGDEAYDIISGPSFHLPTLIVDNMLYNLNDIPYLDFSNQWWTQSLLETTAFGDRIYLVSGDISLGMIKYLLCTYFNKNLADSYGIEDLYATVIDGGWTADKMTELTKGRYADLNGNSQPDIDSDQFGYVINNFLHWRSLIDAFGCRIVYIEDGHIKLSTDDANTFKLYDTLVSWVGKGSSGDIIGTESLNTEAYEIFGSGRALFVMGRFIDCETAYREMTDDFGILPVPKLDEAAEYRSTICGSESTFGVPVNSSKTDYIGAIMEAMAYESFRTVTPAYYESALKIKYTRDDQSARVIDIIKSGARFNPTVQLSKLTGMSPDEIVNNAVRQGRDLAGEFAKIESKLTAMLQEIEETVIN